MSTNVFGGMRFGHVINDLVKSDTTTWSSVEIDRQLERIARGDNLLDNADWRGANVNPLLSRMVNQRGLLSISTLNAYFIDRWITAGASGATWSVENGFLRCVRTENVETNTILEQRIEFPSFLAGEVVTFSFIARGTGSAGITFSNGIAVSFAIPSTQMTDSFSLYTGTVTLPTDTNILNVRLFCSAITVGGFVDFQAVKLERGPISTLANDSIPRFGRMLADCQRFQLEAGSFSRHRAAMITANWIDFFVPVPVTMRASPVLNISVARVREFNGGNIHTGFTIEMVRAISHGVLCRFAKENHGMADAALEVDATLSPNNRILFDANL
jgi:hypothetical protein